MKKSKIKAIEDVIRRQCAAEGITYQKKFSRRARKVYHSIPHFNRARVG